MPQQYPVPVFHFTVQWGGTRIGFSEVTGLTQENQAIEYRDGRMPHPAQQPPQARRKHAAVGIVGHYLCGVAHAPAAQRSQQGGPFR